MPRERRARAPWRGGCVSAKGGLHRGSSDRPIRVMVRTASAPKLAADRETRGAGMLRRMQDMPVGTIGFEAIDEVEDDDWEDTVEPVLRREMADGKKIRLLYLLGAEARDVEGDAVTADTG